MKTFKQLREGSHDALGSYDAEKEYSHFKSGWNAHNRGVGIDSNPHKQTGHKRWKAGWEAAKADSRFRHPGTARTAWSNENV